MAWKLSGLRTCALVAWAILAPGVASASDSIIGGHAGICSVMARSNQHGPDAIQACTEAILGDYLDGRTMAATYVNRATMFIAEMNYGAAMKDVDAAVAIDPTLGAAYVNRGGALLGLGQFPQAEAEINKGLTLMSEQPEKAYANRALARWHQDNVKGAYEDFMKALELKPDWDIPQEQLTHFTVTVRPIKR